MKKLFLIGLLFLGSISLIGCTDIKDGPGMEREIKYLEAEQECIDNDGKISTDELGESICVFFADEWCQLEAIENGDCEYLNHEPGGERITLVTAACEEEGGEIEEWNEGGDRQDVCFYPDESFCYLEDLASDNCHIGDVRYGDEYDLYPYAQHACIDSNGQISQTDEGIDICILSDDEFCYMDDIADGACDLLYQDMLDIQDMHESEKAYQEYVAECYEQPQVTVCGQDGNSYYNRCFMEKAGVEEETELAEVVDGECIYG